MAISIAGPWLIQLITRPLLATNSPAWLIGARRVLANPRVAWRQVASVSLMVLVAVFLIPSMSQVTPDPSLFDEETDPAVIKTNEVFASDIVTSVVIAVAFAFVLSAASILVSQVSDVYQRQDEAISLDRIGTKVGALNRAGMVQVFTPLVPMLVLAILIGVSSSCFSR